MYDIPTLEAERAELRELAAAAEIGNPIEWADSPIYHERRVFVSWWRRDDAEAGFINGDVYVCKREHPGDVWPPARRIAANALVEYAHGYATALGLRRVRG